MASEAEAILKNLPIERCFLAGLMSFLRDFGCILALAWLIASCLSTCEGLTIRSAGRLADIRILARSARWCLVGARSTATGVICLGVGFVKWVICSL